MKFENTGLINGIAIPIALVFPNIITVVILTLSFIYTVHICCQQYEEELDKLRNIKTKGNKK